MEAVIDPTLVVPAASLPELVAAAVTGQVEAWTAIVERFAPLVYSVVRGYPLSPSDASDVQQTLWLRLVEHLKDIREPRALPGWIVITTRNEVRRVLAKRRGIEPVDPQLDPRLDRPCPAELDENLLRWERRNALLAGLAELQPDDRELLTLLFAEPEIPYRQISARLGIPTGSIGPTRARCLRKLRATTPVRALAG
jgi:RNA polymerase sigma factor (sigma-70 family)